VELTRDFMDESRKVGRKEQQRRSSNDIDKKGTHFGVVLRGKKGKKGPKSSTHATKRKGEKTRDMLTSEVSQSE